MDRRNSKKGMGENIGLPKDIRVIISWWNADRKIVFNIKYKYGFDGQFWTKLSGFILTYYNSNYKQFGLVKGLKFVML